MTRSHSFSLEDAQQAHEKWGYSCGPCALAFALGITLDQLHEKTPVFDGKGYANPTMVRAAMSAMGVRHIEDRTLSMFADKIAVVRVQWSGPWTQPGTNPKWSYQYTHWICYWLEDGREMVFDVNAGIVDFAEWKRVTVPAIVATIPRATGGWKQTHVWRLEQ
jgi:hypothetical protein